MNPIFSIIIATYNCEKTLHTCLESLFSQNENSFELLVVDGGSSDQTCAILKEYKKKYPQFFTFLISEKDNGVYSAWNKALPHCRGQWIYFMGADDYLWEEKALKKAKQKLKFVPLGIFLAYGRIAVVSNDLKKILYYEGEPWHHYKWRFKHEMVLPHQATFHRRELFQNLLLFNEEFQICGDVELILREILAHRMPVFLGEDLVFAAMRVGGMSSDYKNVPLIISELKKIRSIHGLGFSYRIFLRELRYKIRYFMKRFLGEKSTLILVHYYRSFIAKK